MVNSDRIANLTSLNLKAAEQGLARAQYNLGEKYYNGIGVARSYEKAVAWFLKAAKQGFAYAQFRLGFMYDCGRGVEQSDAKTREWYQKAAEQGDELAIEALDWLNDK